MKLAAPVIGLALISAGCTGTGLHSFTRPDASAPAKLPQRTCLAQDLGTEVFHQGATGFLMGAFVVRNTSASACRIGGMPHLVILEPDGRQVPVDVRLSDGYHTPTTPLLRALRPGEEGDVFMAWADYCQRRLKAPLTYRMTFPVGPSVTAKTDSATGNCITQGHSAGLVQVTLLSEPT